MVILASDHGEQFGEKGLERHGNSLYQPALVIPLVVWLPGDRHGGTRVNAPVSLRDVARTVLAETGVKADDRFGGRPLSRFWNPSTSAPSDTLIGGVQKRIGTPNEEPNSKGDMNSVFTAQYSYILNGDGTEELFDVRTDPTESVNLAMQSIYAPHLASFRRHLRAQVPVSWLSSMERIGTGSHAQRLSER